MTGYMASIQQHQKMAAKKIDPIVLSSVVKAAAGGGGGGGNGRNNRRCNGGERPGATAT